MTSEEFISVHRLDDVRKLALKKSPEVVDVAWCLQQIEGWQLARKKLPRWAEADGTLWFPPRLSVEQCSSEATAHYKQQLVKRLIPDGFRSSMMDLTGGFGIDFSYIAPLFSKATYVECQAHLCDIAKHNFPLLGLSHAEVVHSDCISAEKDADLIFMDPARRDAVGRKTVAIQDCTPNVEEMQEHLLSRVRYLIIKFSPMLDIAQALRVLHRVVEVHVVSVKGECKELLLVMKGYKGEEESQPCEESTALSSLQYHCVNLETEDAPLVCPASERNTAPVIAEVSSATMQGYLFEPNTSILKAGCQDTLCQLYGIRKLHPCSNLFIGDHPLDAFPGRQFVIVSVSDFNKKGLKTLLQDVKQANLTTRNFPTAVADLRKKLKLQEGGEYYLFATTLHDGSHALVKARRE